MSDSVPQSSEQSSERLAILFEAVHTSQYELAGQMMKESPELLALRIDDRSEWTVLHLAANKGSYLVKDVIAAGADMEARDFMGRTALALAAGGGGGSNMGDLLMAGAVIESQDDKGNRPLHGAAEFPAPWSAHQLLAWGADIDAQNFIGETALHVAVSANQPETALVLQAFGASPVLWDHEGKIPQDRSKTHKFDFLSEELDREHLRTVSSTFYPRDATMLGRGGIMALTPALLQAAATDNRGFLRYVLDSKSAVDRDFRNSKGWSAIHYAAATNSERTLAMLLDGSDHLKYALNSVTYSSDYEFWPFESQYGSSTPLQLATEFGSLATVCALLEYGALDNSKNGYGCYALDIARRHAEMEPGSPYTLILKILQKAASLMQYYGRILPGSINEFRRSLEYPKVPDKDLAGATVALETGDHPQGSDKWTHEMEPIIDAVKELTRHRVVSPELEIAKQTDTRAGRFASVKPAGTTDVESGFDANLFALPLDSAPATQPNTFNEIISNWNRVSEYRANDQPVKFAILDTGIDLDHDEWKLPRIIGFKNGEAIRETQELPQKKRIIGWKNFAEGSETNITDTDGHGTMIAGIILRLAPQAQIYVARVCEGNRNRGNESATAETVVKNPKPEATIKAVDWAIDNGVDLINMSFGFDEYDPEIKDALGRAETKQAVVFAAIANDGNHKKAAWPGRDPQYAIGIHSSNDWGTVPSPFNSPEVPSPRLMVVGENLASHWPTAKGGGLRTGSGTSFATPVAVALAALILAFVNQDISEDHRKKALKFVQWQDLWTVSKMRAMLAYISTHTSDSSASIHSHILWKDYDRRQGTTPEDLRAYGWDTIRKAIKR